MEGLETEGVICDDDGDPCVYAAAEEIRSCKRELDQAYKNFVSTVHQAESEGIAHDSREIVDILYGDPR